VFCWGENEEGELGAGATELFSATPLQVTGISGASSISTGDNHACAVNGDGTASCWGDNTDVQLDARKIRFDDPQASALACQ
jgi:alpha-tubulin suppressor-like RCC1 family protein